MRVAYGAGNDAGSELLGTWYSPLWNCLRWDRMGSKPGVDGQE